MTQQLTSTEELLVKMMQQGYALTAVFQITPAYAYLTSPQNTQNTVEIGDVLSLESYGLIKRFDLVVGETSFDLTDSGKAWPNDMTPEPVYTTPQKSIVWYVGFGLLALIFLVFLLKVLFG